MARGRYLSLEEARNMGKIDQFAKEHPLVGTKRIFDDLLDAMAHGEKPDSQLKKGDVIFRVPIRVIGV